jgi:cysteine desulfurase
MLPYLSDGFGNANSIHSWGQRAHEAVERARSQVAALVEADDPSQIFFTSGASEANSWVVRSFENGIVSPFEHSSMLNPAGERGWSMWGNDQEELLETCGRYELASVMAVNNEIGARWDIRDEQVDANALHVDATQIVGKLPFSVQGLDFVSMSAHKLYGPKGVGALFCAGMPPEPLILGGEQEQGFRSGTLNVPGIVGFGAAAEFALAEREENLAHAEKLRSIFLEELGQTSGWEVQGGPKTSPFILGISFEGVEGETLVIETDRAGYAISSGAACSSRSNEPSHVLQAMGIDLSLIRGTVRMSFGKYNSIETTGGLARSMTQSVEKLRTMTWRLSNQRNAAHGNARL